MKYLILLALFAGCSGVTPNEPKKARTFYTTEGPICIVHVDIYSDVLIHLGECND